MSDPRRWIDEGEASLEGSLFRAGRAEAAPAAAKARALAALGLAEGSAAPARARRALPADATGGAASPAPARARRKADAGPGDALFRGVLSAEGRAAGTLGPGWAAAAALAAAAAVALLVPALRRSEPAGSVQVDLREAGPSVPPAETAPVRLSGSEPVYTPEALAARVEGDAQVKCTVTEEGKLVDCTILRSVPFMDRAVLEALASWRFSPATRRGRAVAMEQVFTVRLALPR